MLVSGWINEGLIMRIARKMKRPEKVAFFFALRQAGAVSGERVPMKKIILVSREPADHKRLIALLESVFPECSIEIVEAAGGWPLCRNELLEREQGSHVGGAS